MTDSAVNREGPTVSGTRALVAFGNACTTATRPLSTSAIGFVGHVTYEERLSKQLSKNGLSDTGTDLH